MDLYPTLKLLLWVLVAAFIGARFGSIPPAYQELVALKEDIARLQRSVNRHDHLENIEGVWVTDAAMFCYEWVKDGEEEYDLGQPRHQDRGTTTALEDILGTQ